MIPKTCQYQKVNYSLADKKYVRKYTSQLTPEMETLVIIIIVAGIHIHAGLMSRYLLTSDGQLTKCT